MQPAAVLYVADLERVGAFYRECFSLLPLDSGPDFCGLTSPTWRLTLVRGPHPPVIAVPPVRRAQTPVKLAFTVINIEDLRPVVQRLGGAVEPAASSWLFRGALHCDCLDPEGNVIQLIEQPVARG